MLAVCKAHILGNEDIVRHVHSCPKSNLLDLVFLLYDLKKNKTQITVKVVKSRMSISIIAVFTSVGFPH